MGPGCLLVAVVVLLGQNSTSMEREYIVMLVELAHERSSRYHPWLLVK